MPGRHGKNIKVLPFSRSLNDIKFYSNSSLYSSNSSFNYSHAFSLAV